MELTVVFVVFRAPVAHFAEIVEVSKQLLSAFIVLGMKVIATEQYPKGHFVMSFVYLHHIRV